MMFKAWVIMKETLKEQCREKIMAFFIVEGVALDIGGQRYWSSLL